MYEMNGVSGTISRIQTFLGEIERAIMSKMMTNRQSLLDSLLKCAS